MPSTFVRVISSVVAQSETSAPQWKTKSAAVDGACERARARQVADGDLDVEPLEVRGVAAGAHEAAHGVALGDEPLREAPADEAARAGDEADVVA